MGKCMTANELAILLEVDSWYKLVTRKEIATMLRHQQVRIEQLLETQDYLYKRHDEQQAEIEALKATIGKITISSNLTDEEIAKEWAEHTKIGGTYDVKDIVFPFARAILRKAQE